MEIRPARKSDLESVQLWTADTFSWGDYIDSVFERWRLDPLGNLLVMADENDEPLALCNVAMVSPTEAWLQGARVHPDHRRRGLATEMTGHACQWAKGWGAQVVRLMVEEGNDPAHEQVQSAGFRSVGTWTVARRQVGDGSVIPAGNGGRPILGGDRLVLASSAEAQPAFVAWSSDEIGRTARGLVPNRWIFRRLLLDDLEKEARKQRLWVAPGGWVMARPVGDTLIANWIHTSSDHAYDVARSLNLLADELHMERIESFFPSIGWLNQGFRRAGSVIRQDVVYARSL
ncbi:MAG: GNAT family N-acetyltransferase [Acidimicrobiia bacterium]|nr:GNAT family N-acetyltransferase [Acidimicrobiia bacterium]